MPNSKFLIPDITTSQDLTAAALNFTTSIGRPFKLNEIHIHFSVVVTETITIKINSAQGANYDAKKVSRSLVAEQDFVYRPQGEATYQSGDEIDIDITNANETGVAYVTVKAEELHN
tara:strand:+ start:277 stop:627 length:351 start_codon:yes stop_codon:yes gene_type:complete